MSNFNLSPEEVRILGCLMEKSVVTPDTYPLTLNALTNACNQKSSREPVMSLEPGNVQSATRRLKEKHYVRIEENFKNGIEKYTQTFCNTNFGDIQLTPQQFAIICLLLLRGPQTPGELRTRSNRLHAFADNQEVQVCLNELLAREGRHSLIVKLPRKPGRKDSEYMHLLGGPIENIEHPTTTVPSTGTNNSPNTVDPAEKITSTGRAITIDPGTLESLLNRVAQLEADVAELKALIE